MTFGSLSVLKDLHPTEFGASALSKLTEFTRFKPQLSFD